MKLCKDCKYGPEIIDCGMFGGINSNVCRHPYAPVDPVYGRKDASYSLMRSPNCLIDHCGPNGDWFEEAPKPVFEPKPYSIIYYDEPEAPSAEPKKKFWRIFG